MKGECFAKFFSAVDKPQEFDFKLERHIWANPEMDTKNGRPVLTWRKGLKKLWPTELTRAGNIPGFYADLDTGDARSENILISAKWRFFNLQRPS